MNDDLLLLSPDTEVTESALEEMRAVLHLHERHGVVSPRGNESYEVWQRITPLLPRYQIVPNATRFCLLIKREVLELLGPFDDDFVSRINRRGYSAVIANRAYVFNHGPAEPYENRDPVERFASLYAPHKPRILYDLFHLPPGHSGTSDFGLNLLRNLAHVVEGKFDLFVGINQPERFFAHELTGYQMYEDRLDAAMTFDLVFKPCQMLSWKEFARMERLAPRVSFTMMDIIGVRCDYLNSPRRQMVLQKTAELSDLVFSISEFSASDFNHFYQTAIPFKVVYHGTNAGMTSGEFRDGEYVLVVGNQLAHKGVQEAVRRLTGELPVVVLGGKEEATAANVRWLTSGGLSRQYMRELFARARVLVYPSYYEGFGLPVVDALALGKPVVVLGSALNRELAVKFNDSNFHRISSFKELNSLVEKLFAMESARPEHEPRRWRDAAEEYGQAFDELLNRDFDAAKIRARWDLLRTLETAD